MQAGCDRITQLFHRIGHHNLERLCYVDKRKGGYIYELIHTAPAARKRRR